MKKTLTIVIPIFNGFQYLEDILASISRQYADWALTLEEVLIVNDGSTDATREDFIAHERQEPFCRKVIVHKENLGKGAAIKTGMRHSRGDHILFLDVDQSTGWKSVSSVIEQAHKNPEAIICGSRGMENSIVKKPQSSWRSFMGRVGSITVKNLFSLKVIDTQCGCKIFPRKVIPHILEQSTINRWAIDIELLLICKKLDVDLIEVPIIWSNAPRSQVKPWHFITTALEVVRIYFSRIF